MRIILLALTIPLLAAHSPLQAQSDAATRALIQQLSRVPNVERGIRFSAPADAGAPAGQSVARPVAPALPASEQAAAVPAARAPQVAEPRRRTTAPADVPSASITVTFPSGSAELTPAAEAALLPLGRALSSQDLDAFRFRIEGHTDRVGPRDLNQMLSQRRAEAVRDFLVRRYRIDPARVETVGRGEDDLLVTTEDEVASAANRRVQVLNLGR